MRLNIRSLAGIAFDAANAARYLTYELAIKPIGRAFDRALPDFGSDDE